MAETLSADDMVRRPEFERALDDIDALKLGQARLEATMEGISAKLSEFHGENRARAEHQATVMAGMSAMIEQIDAKMDRGLSIRSTLLWIGIAVGGAWSYATAHFARWMQ